jgi:phytoene dehydrogenase-like protein
MNTVFAIAPSIEYLEKAADSVKYGRVPENPYIEFTIPSLVHKDFAPDGKHVLSATVQNAPYHLREQNWDDRLKDQLRQNVINVLEKYLPGFSPKIELSYLLTPVDIEKQFGLTEGNINHGEMTLDQFMFMRPTISAAQYKTPLENLYLCGPGTHPGGGLHGTNGFNAAREILKR